MKEEGGRITWSLRRMGFFPFVGLCCCIFSKHTIFSLIAENTLFSWAFICSVPVLILGNIISVAYKANYDGEKPSGFVLFLWLTQNLYEDVLAPVYCGIIQLPMGLIKDKQGYSVDWGGIIFDFIWTWFLIVFTLIGIAAL